MQALEQGQSTITPIVVIVEGVIERIELEARNAEQIGWLNTEEKDAVKLVFFGGERYFIQLFDHRRASVDAYKDGFDALSAVFQQGGCLGRFAKKKGQYIALADPDDPRTDIMPTTEGIVLTRIPFDRSRYRVMAEGRAQHLDTGICFCRQLPPKEA